MNVAEMKMSSSDFRPVRVGAVSYLNSKPLIEGLEQLIPEADVVLDYPSRLADQLAAGDLDVALIPSIEYFRDPGYEIISDACVATHGAVLSVKLFSRVHPGEIRRLALDAGSRTSSTLARIILAEKYGVFPQLEILPIDRSTLDTSADAIVLIGDRAMHAPDESFCEVWDLGTEWKTWTGLPFVFAMWVARADAPTEGLADVLCRARDHGLMSLERIAHREAGRLGIDEGTAFDYLHSSLYFRLGSAERTGLRLFRQFAAQLGLIPEGHDLVFRDYATAGQSSSG